MPSPHTFSLGKALLSIKTCGISSLDRNNEVELPAGPAPQTTTFCFTIICWQN
jgi:hypothetical protein